jgi:hypothetical protein
MNVGHKQGSGTANVAQSEALTILKSFSTPVLEFLNNLGGLEPRRNRVVVTGPAGYTAWRNWFLGIDSWAPLKFKNSGSESY